ncbi:MAG TPA: dCTP deaminase, partial [Candidatus Thermoplasmatota archaeon]
MCILSDRDIRERLEQKNLSIEPFVEKNLTPNGYDLSVKEVVLRQSGDKIAAGEAIVPPGASFLISTKEYV